MEKELEQFTRNDVWELVARSEGVNVVGTKWIFKNKNDGHGEVVQNKARLVAQGYSQIEGVYVEETVSSVARLESIRLFLGMACILNFKVVQMEGKSTFLNGVLQEEVYVEHPKGVEDSKHRGHVYRLKKTVYGLKQAPRALYERLTGFLVNGFVENMTREFELSMCGELKYFLGLRVTQSDQSAFIAQSTFAHSLVMRFGLENSKVSRTPMSMSMKLAKDEAGDDVDATLYCGMIGSLLYLTASRLDMSFSVKVCARYQGKMKVSHLNAVKSIIKYIKGTENLGVYYSRNSSKDLVGYCNADWGVRADDRKRTRGGWFFLGNNLISWLSKKQNVVSLSAAEAESIAIGSCCTQLRWMKQMSTDYGMSSGPFLVHCDNKTAIYISQNPVQHSRTKHIDIRHHFMRELVEDNQVIIEHAVTALQLADIFTKPLDLNRFITLRNAIGVCNLDC